MTSLEDTTETGDVAIVGMAGRFPGARNVDEFWENLREGVESVSFFTEERLRAAGVSPAELGRPGYVPAGAEIEGVDLFDADFFGYTAREAQMIDPQQRLFLETAWEALECAGYDAEQYDRDIGVFGGSSTGSAYLTNVFANMERGAAIGEEHVGLGVEVGYLTTRVSYQLGLRGPSFAVQTACSTGLVAVHLACQSLLNYECDMALCGASAYKSSPGTGYVAAEGAMLSPDGHCRPFDADARGTLFGSGVGAVVLKRLADAVADGDTVYAVVKGSAINNDGAVKPTFTAPGVAGQAEVIAQALANAGVDADTIGYVEAHGTGTALGDPIEIRALTKAFAESGGGAARCALGSVKSNFGHLDAAAGIAGLLKVVLALRYEMLPPTLHFSKPNPEIDFAAGPFRVQDRLASWPRNGAPRRGGVSAFGFGGTNAHVVLEEAPAPAAVSPSPDGSRLLVLSARTEEALEHMTDRLAAHLRRHAPEPADVAYTLARGRRALPWRRVTTGTDVESIAATLEARDPARVITRHLTTEPPGVAFLLSGQGAQYPGMGRELYDHEPAFREAVDECAEVLGPTLGSDLRDHLFADPGDEEAGLRLRRTEVAQPALFAVEYGLVRLLRSWGIVPRALLGHSLGEYVAACVAGVFALPDTLRLVALRGRLMQARPPGAMLSVGADRETVASLLPEELSLAAHNGPRDCVVSGEVAAVEAFAEVVAARGLAAQPVATSHAFHSAAMEPVAAELAAAVAAVSRRAPEVPFVSNVTGDWITEEQAQDPEYWSQHALATVEFAAGVATVAEDPDVALVEVGPGQTLSSLARRVVPGAGHRLITATLPHRGDRRGALETVQRALGRLWTAGVTPDWQGFFQHERRRRIALPTYPFERRRHWLEPQPPRETADEGRPGPHPLLDRMLVRTRGEAVFRTDFSAERHWVLAEHRLLGEGIVPGTTYLDMATAAARAYWGTPATEIRDVDFPATLLVPEGERREVHTKVRELDDGLLEFTVVSHDPGASGREWTEHACGKIGAGPLGEVPRRDPAALAAACGITSVDLGRRQAEHRTMRYGPRWQQSLQIAHVGVASVLAPLELPPEYARDDADHTLHPALLDLATGIHGFAVLGPDEAGVIEGAAGYGEQYLPVGYDRIAIHGPIPARGFAFARPHQGHEGNGPVRKVDVTICDESGATMVDVRGFAAKRVNDPPRFVRRLRGRARHHTLRWMPAPPAPAGGRVPDSALVIQDDGSLGGRLAEALRARGTRVIEAGLAPEEGYERLLAEFDDGPPEHVVYVAADARDLDTLEDQLDRGVYGLFELAKVLGGRRVAPVRLTVIAPWADRVTGDEPATAPAHAALFGLTKVIGHEIEGMLCRCLDVAGDTPPASLCAEVLAEGQPGHVAFRDGRRYVSELTPLELTEPPAAELPPDVVHLITGGLGGLGLQVALHFARTRPCARLALVGRSAAPPRERWPDILRDPGSHAKDAVRVAALQEIEACGARVHCYQADVSDETEMARVVGAVRRELGRIGCVVHAAGVAGDGFVFRKPREVFQRTLAPKVLGAAVLDAVTGDDPPDLMVLFGSTVAMLGAAGQGDYAAANMYLGGFGDHRNARGRPTVTIDWTDWLETGMAADHGVERDQGFFRSISVAEGLASLEEILAAGCPRVIVGEINHERLEGLGPDALEERLRGAPIVLSAAIRQAIGSARGGEAESRAAAPETGPEVRLAGRPGGTYSPTEQKIARIWGRELGLDELNIFENSFDLGANSLTALRIAQNVQRLTGVRVGMADLFRYVTVAELAEYVDGEAK